MPVRAASGAVVERPDAMPISTIESLAVDPVLLRDPEVPDDKFEWASAGSSRVDDIKVGFNRSFPLLTHIKFNG